MNTGPVCEAQTSMPATTLTVVSLGLGTAELLPPTFVSTIGAVLRRRLASTVIRVPGYGIRQDRPDQLANTGLDQVARCSGQPLRVCLRQ